MPGDCDDIFLIPVHERFLLHAPLHGVTAMLNSAAAGELRDVIASGSPDGACAAIRPLARKLLTPPLCRPRELNGSFSPRYLSLLLTTDCNLRCQYCAPVSGEGSCMTMTEETASAALDYYAGVVERDRLPSYSVYFHGGEPFLPWKLMEFCVSEGRRHASRLGVPFSATATTNGFMASERAEWIANNMWFVIVSLDGPPEIHNRLRPTEDGGRSFEAIAHTLDIFDARAFRYGIRCNIDRESAPRIPEIAEFLCSRFSPSVINLGPLVRTGRSERTGLYPPRVADFVAGAIAAGKIAEEHGVGLMLTMARTDRIARSHCDVANDQFIVTSDGMVSSCYLADRRDSEYASNFMLGEFKPGQGMDIDMSRIRAVRGFEVANIPRCKDCFCKWHCSGGCRIFHTPPYCSEPQTPECEVTQRLTLWQLLRQSGYHEEADSVAEGANAI